MCGDYLAECTSYIIEVVVHGRSRRTGKFLLIFRRVAREKTDAQTAIAEKWNASDPFAVWNETASTAIRRHRLSDTEAARIFAVMNAGVSDALT